MNWNIWDVALKKYFFWFLKSTLIFNHTFWGIKREFPLQYPSTLKALACNSNDTSMPPYIETTLGYTSLTRYMDNQILGLRAADHTPRSPDSQNKRRKADCDCSQNPILKDLNSSFAWSPSQINRTIRRNQTPIKSPGPQAWCQESPRGSSSAEDLKINFYDVGRHVWRSFGKEIDTPGRKEKISLTA